MSCNHQPNSNSCISCLSPAYQNNVAMMQQQSTASQYQGHQMTLSNRPQINQNLSDQAGPTSISPGLGERYDQAIRQIIIEESRLRYAETRFAECRDDYAKALKYADDLWSQLVAERELKVVKEVLET